VKRSSTTGEATAPRRRRPRGEGSIYETKSGRWRGAIVVTDPDTGASVRRVTSGRDYDEALERLRKLRDSVERGDVTPGGARTVAAYAQTWLPALRHRVRESTWRGHEINLRLYVLPVVGKTKLRALTPVAVERMTGGMLQRGLAPLTARGARGTLRMLLRDAERDGLVVRNAAALARPPRVERHELRVLTAAETRRFLEGTADDALGPLFALAATTGMRQGEILGLRWTDIDLDVPTPTLTVRRSLARSVSGWADAETKTSRSRRTLELPPMAAAALRRQRAWQEEERPASGDGWQDAADTVFTDATGRRVLGRAVAEAFTRALARLALPAVRFHDLRHGAASLMLAEGVPLAVISRTLGHATISITADVYSHLTRELRRDAAHAMDRALGDGS